MKFPGKLAFLVLVVLVSLLIAVPVLAAPSSPSPFNPADGLYYDPVAEYYSGLGVSAGTYQTATITMTEATDALTDLGLLPVITLGAVIFVAGVVYKRFRR